MLINKGNNKKVAERKVPAVGGSTAGAPTSAQRPNLDPSLVGNNGFVNGNAPAKSTNEN